MSETEKNLSILGHFSEMRKRLIRSVVVLVIMIIVAFVFWERLVEILLIPAPEGVTLQAIKMTEMFGTTMRISLVTGAILAMPYLTYELLMFVSPALTRSEKRYVYIILPWIALMFIGGVVFAYFIMIPNITNFLLSWGADLVTPQPMFSDYINIVTRMLLVSGLVFELPVLITFLARFGIIKPQWLASKWRGAVIISFILAAIITPTPDPINQSIVAGVLIFLYGLSLLLSKLVYREKHLEEEIEAPPSE
ncbi:MAG: twin-arginine translocase subunit TatC [Dehalococcoidales bacterium]|nr:MAG: twin-arginine translocase subunit TatC [Dehalococcoidales bacterium]